MVDGEVRWADDVSRDAVATCRFCGDEMHIRASHTTASDVFKPRCFVHNPSRSDATACPGGESDTHRLMKYVAGRALEMRFDQGTVSRERQVPGTDRTGDVVVEFDGLEAGLGRGVVAEIQYRNTGKDVEQVTAEYLAAGYSVYWMQESDFGDGFERLTLPEPEIVGPLGAPSKTEWSGLAAGVAELETMSSRSPITAAFPPIWWRETIFQRWRVGRLRGGNDEYSTVVPLSENNATRPCGVCGEPAVVLLGTSTFRCGQHLPDVDDFG